MSALLIQLFFAVLAAASIGLFAGRWWQRGIARKREQTLKLRLKARNRFSQRLDSDLESTTSDQLPKGHATTSKVHTVASTLDENERLKFEIAQQQTEAERLHTGLTSTTQELEQERENSENLRSQMEHWQNSFTALQAQQSQLEAAKLSMDRQVADLQLATEERNQALADKQILLNQIEENDAQLAKLAQTQDASSATQQENEELKTKIVQQQTESKSLQQILTSATQELEQERENSEFFRSQVEYWQNSFTALQSQQSQLAELAQTQDANTAAQQENQQLNSICADLRQNLDAANNEREQAASKLANVIAQAEKLEGELAEAQRSLRDSQQQSERFQTERDALRLRRVNIDEILNASILKHLPETNAPESKNSAVNSKPPAKAGTASRSMPHRIKALETIVRNQRTKIEVLRDVVEDMQNVLQFESVQPIRKDQEISSLAANEPTKANTLGLIKGSR